MNRHVVSGFRNVVSGFRNVVSGFSRTKRSMFRRSAGILGAVLVALIVRTAVPSADAPQQPAAQAVSAEAAFLNQYCITCHNQRTKAAGLALDTLDIASVGPGAETWEKAVKKIRTA